MTDNTGFGNASFGENAPLQLEPKQRHIVALLEKATSEAILDKYPLAEWYLGAIYALKNTHNPDRFSQAAHSLRELLEKLPRVLGDQLQVSKSNFLEMRQNLYDRLCMKDKKRYSAGWKDEIINSHLDETIRKMENYLELNKKPSRREQIASMVSRLDPRHDALNSEFQNEKHKKIGRLWGKIERLAHHSLNSPINEALEQIENLIMTLLAPTTAEDQSAIQEIIDKSKPNEVDIETLIELIKKRGANCEYFFKKVTEPIWLSPLKKHGFFSAPPEPIHTEGVLCIPLWLPILYLQRVSAKAPEQVVEIILGIEGIKETENPLALHEIFTIACELPNVEFSLRLKPLILKFLYRNPTMVARYFITTILQKWGGSSNEDARDTAYKIMRCVITFQPEGSASRFDSWAYESILKEGVRPLAEHDPFWISKILIKAVKKMLALETPSGKPNETTGQDYSDFWCPRLDKESDDNNEQQALVQTLFHACKQVYEKERKSIAALDKELSSHHWKVFRRLRYLLYASYLHDQILPWIRKELLEYEDYSKFEHRYEFQLMARKASEYFGDRLLNERERSIIFDDILNGPSEKHEDELSLERKRYFHYMQLRPFATLLNEEKLRDYFNELESENSATTDDSYMPHEESEGRYINFRSPKSIEELKNFTDEQLLTYINDWENDDWQMEVNISELAKVFCTLFKNAIVPNTDRLSFWMKKRDEIARPIYIAAMLDAMCELIQEKDCSNIKQWFQFCEWVLEHQDSAQEEDRPEFRNKLSNHPNWRNARRAVVDFIEACVDKDASTPIDARGRLAELLEQACTQLDWCLDHNQPILLNHDDPFTEAINNTRSRALQTIVQFGFWVRRHLPKDDVLEVTDILSKRFASNAKHPLTRPEQAMLGWCFEHIYLLNQNWVVAHLQDIFPRKNTAAECVAFNSYITNNPSNKQMFEILHAEFQYVIENLNIQEAMEKGRWDFIDALGDWVFGGYLWECSPLQGDESLLAHFYKKTNSPCRARLFKRIGIDLSLKKSSTPVEQTLLDRSIAFFDWRLESADSLELREFAFWLQAECLDPAWRLRSFSRILDLGLDENADRSLILESLNSFLPDQLALVIECLLKITTAKILEKPFFIKERVLLPILKQGLAAEDSTIRETANDAKENLLRKGIITIADLPNNDSQALT